MATKRHKPEEIVSKLRQVDVLVGQMDENPKAFMTLLTKLVPSQVEQEVSGVVEEPTENKWVIEFVDPTHDEGRKLGLSQRDTDCRGEAIQPH